MIEKLLLRDIEVDSKDKIKKMKELWLKYEFPDDVKWKGRTFFMPKLLTDPDWSRDVVEETLKKLDDVKHLRTND